MLTERLVVVSGERESISPELVLVDPELAARARSWLPEPGTLARLSAIPLLPGSEGPLADSASALPVPSRRHAQVLAGAAVVLVATLLLADVRLEVGKTGASAESLEAAESSAAPSSDAQVRRLGGSPPEPVRGNVPRRLAWAPVTNASAYRLELFQGTTRVFMTTTSRPQFTLPRSWKHDGRTQTLEPGVVYGWYVWPIVSGRRASSASVQARLVVPSR